MKVGAVYRLGDRLGTAGPSSRTPGEEVRLDPHLAVRRILVLVLVLELLALAGDYVFNFYDVAGEIRIRRIFNIAREESIPTWLSSTQALALATTAWVVSRLARRDGSRKTRRGWLGVAAFFLYVSIDDAASIHERLGSALEEAFASSPWVSQYPSFGWQILLAPLLALGLFASAAFIWRQQPSTTARVLVIAALVGFALAQGIDYLEGVENLFYDWSRALVVGEYTVSHTLRAIEEMLEMLSTTALWAPVLWHLADRASRLRIEMRTVSQGREAYPAT